MEIPAGSVRVDVEGVLVQIGLRRTHHGEESKFLDHELARLVDRVALDGQAGKPDVEVEVIDVGGRAREAPNGVVRFWVRESNLPFPITIGRNYESLCQQCPSPVTSAGETDEGLVDFAVLIATRSLAGSRPPSSPRAKEPCSWSSLPTLERRPSRSSSGSSGRKVGRHASTSWPRRRGGRGGTVEDPP